jgi:hypothetical protein
MSKCFNFAPANFQGNLVHQSLPMSTPLEAFLVSVPVGPIEDKAAVERLLAEEWYSLAGSDSGGMRARKLIGRTERLEWRPPMLKFAIERHGGIVNGATRAELQNWEVNMETRSAEIAKIGRRQLYRTSKRLNVHPLAEAAAKAIIHGLDNPSLKRYPDGRVRVQIGSVVPDEGVQQTTTGRRKRFRNALEPLLAEAGWVPVGVNTYQRKAF